MARIDIAGMVVRQCTEPDVLETIVAILKAANNKMAEAVKDENPSVMANCLSDYVQATALVDLLYKKKTGKDNATVV